MQRPACGGLTHRKHRMQNAVISVEWVDDGVSDIQIKLSHYDSLCMSNQFSYVKNFYFFKLKIYFCYQCLVTLNFVEETTQRRIEGDAPCPATEDSSDLLGFGYCLHWGQWDKWDKWDACQNSGRSENSNQRGTLSSIYTETKWARISIRQGSYLWRGSDIAADGLFGGSLLCHVGATYYIILSTMSNLWPSLWSTATVHIPCDIRATRNMWWSPATQNWINRRALHRSIWSRR